MRGSMQILEIKILNWRKYQCRSEKYQSTNWLRINNDMYESPVFNDLSPSEFRFWIFLLLLCSKRAHVCGYFTSTVLTLTKVGKFRTKVVKSALCKLEQLKIVECTPSMICVTQSTPPGIATLRNITLRNKTLAQKSKSAKSAQKSKNAQTHFCECDFDFDALYQFYPRKRGKQCGIEKCRKAIKNESDYRDLKTAIENYAKHCKETEVAPKFQKYFSTFMNDWRDWLSMESEEVQTTDYSKIDLSEYQYKPKGMQIEQRKI